MRESLKLAVGGRVFTGWQSAAVARDMDHAAHEFVLVIANVWRQWDYRTLRAGAAATLSLDNERILTGYIDDVEREYDAKRQTLTVRGRSTLCDLVDCASLGREFVNQKLDAIAREVCKPFGLDVIGAVDPGAPFVRVRADDGQSPWEFLDYLARQRALRLACDAQGRLVITQAGSRLADTVLRLGENLISAKGSHSHRERFSTYTVLGKNSAYAGNDSAGLVHVAASVNDANVKRHRPLVILADDDGDAADCQTQAEWQRNVYFSRSQTIVYNVREWRERPGGAIWAPNTRVRIDDAYMDLAGEGLIVASQLLLHEDGATAELTVMPRSGFERSSELREWLQ